MGKDWSIDSPKVSLSAETFMQVNSRVVLVPTKGTESRLKLMPRHSASFLLWSYRFYMFVFIVAFEELTSPVPISKTSLGCDFCKMLIFTSADKSAPALTIRIIFMVYFCFELWIAIRMRLIPNYWIRASSSMRFVEVAEWISKPKSRLTSAAFASNFISDTIFFMHFIMFAV